MCGGLGVLGALRDQGGSGSALYVAAVEWFCNGCDEPFWILPNHL